MWLGRRLLYLVPATLFTVLVAAYLIPALDPRRDPSRVASALIDKPAPEFALAPLIEGEAGLATADLAGRVSLINFFASWCGPCRIEHPLLMRLAGEHGVTIFGIDYKDPPEAARRWLAQDGNPFARIGVDPTGRTAIDFGVYGVPETYVIDRSGRIRHRHVGPLDAATVEEVILPMLDRLRQ